MNCPKCGAPNADSANTCQECGTSLPQRQALRTTSGTATASLVCAILGWTVLPVIGAIMAVVLGHMARNEIRASGGSLGGDGMATASLVLGYASIGLAALGAIVSIALAALGIFLPVGLFACGLCGG
jgi:Domain of unknown function (DUF4190)/zinc-ribbon domain